MVVSFATFLTNRARCVATFTSPRVLLGRCHALHLLERARQVIPVERPWVNPDCGPDPGRPETERQPWRIWSRWHILRSRLSQRSWPSMMRR